MTALKCVLKNVNTEGKKKKRTRDCLVLLEQLLVRCPVCTARGVV